MTEKTITEKLYEVLDKGATTLEGELQLSYLESLAEMGEILFQGIVEINVKEETKQEILGALSTLPKHDEIQKEEYRRAMQLAILKGMKTGTQPHHAMTPDTVSLFTGYLVNKILSYEEKKPAYILLDPAVGTGNLLTAIQNNTQKKIHGIGMEPDETLLKLAYVNSNLQENAIDLFHQDSVSSPLVKNVDIVVTDLPAGYYPNDEAAKKFELATKDGHSFVHYLLIEQTLTYIKPGGFLIYIVPNFLFETEGAKELHQYIKKEALIYSFLQLPKTMFKNENWGKSILILRKRKDGIKGPKQALLAELPSFSKEAALNDMIKRISSWFDQQLS